MTAPSKQDPLRTAPRPDYHRQTAARMVRCTQTHLESLMRRRPLAGPVLLLTLMAGAGAGCARRSEFVLHQPFAPASQRELELTSQCAFSSAEAQRRTCLLAFPRPGADNGLRDFLIYLSLPAGLGVTTVDPADPAAARGFLIQKVGHLKGKVTFTSGAIQCRKVFLNGALRRLELDVRGEDGTHIVGTAFIETDPREIRTFERCYAADVSLLGPPSSQPTRPDEETAPRPAASP